MTLPNNPFATPSGVPQPSQEPSEASSLPAPTGAPVMMTPAADRYGAAPLYAGPSNTARSSLSMRGRIAAWTIIILQGISLVNGFIPYHFDHLDDYVSQLSNPLFWFWRLMGVVVIALAVVYLSKGTVIARYVASCIIVVLFFIVGPVMLVVRDDAWYYAFIPNPDIYETGALGARVLLTYAREWICVIAAILLAIPDFKRTPAPYVVSAPVPAAGAAPAGHGPVPSATPEGASSKAMSEASSAQVTNASGFASRQ